MKQISKEIYWNHLNRFLYVNNFVYDEIMILSDIYLRLKSNIRQRNII